MIIQNFREILRLESENNTYEVMDQARVKQTALGTVGIFQSFHYCHICLRKVLWHCSKFQRNFQNGFWEESAIKWLTFGTNKIFFQIIHYCIFSLHIVTYHQSIFRKNSLNRSWDPGESIVSPTYDKNDPFSDLETQSLPSK